MKNYIIEKFQNLKLYFNKQKRKEILDTILISLLIFILLHHILTHIMLKLILNVHMEFSDVLHMQFDQFKYIFMKLWNIFYSIPIFKDICDYLLNKIIQLISFILHLIIDFCNDYPILSRIIAFIINISIVIYCFRELFLKPKK